jgi:hypothetical protein
MRITSYNRPKIIPVQIIFIVLTDEITDKRLTFFLIDIVGGGVQLGPLGTAANNRPIVPAQGDYDDEEIGGIGKTEVLGENLPQCRSVHHKPHMLPGRESGPPRWEASD